MSILDSVKAHPYLIGGVVIGGFVLVMLLNSSGSNGNAQAAVDSSGNANDFNNAVLAAQTQLAGAGIQTTQQAQAEAAQVTIAQTNAAVTDNANTLAAQVAEFETQVQGNVQTTHDTLGAQVQEDAINAAVSQTQINAAASEHNADTIASTQVTIAGLNQATVSQQIASNERIVADQLATSASIFNNEIAVQGATNLANAANAKPRSLLQQLFG